MNGIQSHQTADLVEKLYTLNSYQEEDQEEFFSIMQEKFVTHPSEEFISSLFKEELRRFKEGYHQADGDKIGPRNQNYEEKLTCSRTVSHFLLKYKVQTQDRITYDRKTYQEISRKPPVIDEERYAKLVTLFLENVPADIFEHEILSPQAISLKYDYYSIVSLVFERVIQTDDKYEFASQFLNEPEILDQIYQDSENTKVAIPFWLHRGIRLLKRGATIDVGYIQGGSPVFVAFAKDGIGKIFCPLLIKHLKKPNRSGVADIAPIHAAIAKRLKMPILEQLIRLGADIEARCSDGLFSATKRTALEVASSIGNHEAVRVLLQHQADPNSYSVLDSNLSCFDHEPILTPFQAALSKGSPATVAEFITHKEKTGVPLIADLAPREKEKRSDKYNFMERGEATLDSRAAAIQIQTAANQLIDVFKTTGLIAYAEDFNTRYQLSRALFWIFNKAPHGAAGAIWRPLLEAFKNEIQTNREFKLTAMTHKAVGACYNNDTQADIYIYPHQGEFTYKHILPHEIAHLYSMKYQTSPFDFLQNFKDAMTRDRLLDIRSAKYCKLPWELRELIESLLNSSHYKISDYHDELFPRVCIQFPIQYTLTHPDISEKELHQLMREIMPETFKLYCELVMKMHE